MKALLIVLGIVLTLTGVGAIIGIPLLIIGLSIKSSKNNESYNDDDEIIELAVCYLDREVLFSTRLRPSMKQAIHPEAQKVHHIKIMDLEKCPTFAEYCGDWSTYHGNYRWQRLSNHANDADHTAAGDCLATQYIIQKMVNNVI